MGRYEKVTSKVVKTLREHKAENVKVYNVKERTPFSDYYVLATALNVRHVNALNETLIEELEKNNIHVSHIEGKKDANWILIDLHHVIVNIFTEEERNRIDLEDLFKKPKLN